ncbi:actinodefensin-associated protein B [Streptomyces sp. NPDC054887]
MTTPGAPARTPAPVLAVLRLAPHVTLTRLPYGGCVLLDTVTLTVAECGEPQAVVLDRLLSSGLSATEGDSPAALLAHRLLTAGWLTACPPAGRSAPGRREG